MGRECRYCVDYAIGLIKELKEAEKKAVEGKISESNTLIESAQEMLGELVKAECLTKAVAAPTTDNLLDARAEENPKAKAAILWGTVGGIHYDLATDVANFCQKRKE